MRHGSFFPVIRIVYPLRCEVTMIGNFILHELRHNFLNLRFYVMFLLTLLVFGIGTVAFVNNYKIRIVEYEQTERERTAEIKKLAEKNATRMAIFRQSYCMKPRANSFISDSREKYIPNSFQYSVFAVYGFQKQSGVSNPFLKAFNELNWGFIVTILISFSVFLFIFDSISGEKERRTLAITLSNSVSRGTLLFGKYLSSIVTTLFIIIPCICLSLAIIITYGTIDITAALSGDIAVFLLASVLFIACIASFGLLASVLVRQSNVSMLIALVLWIVMVVIIPNTALFWSHAFFPIENSKTINKRIDDARKDINSNYDVKSYISNESFPSTPQHEVHVKRVTEILNREMQIKNEYYQKMFRQLERTRLITFFSPVSLFDYLCEGVVGGGYLRFLKIWNSLHTYQPQFMQFFKEFDANDPDSPHWLHPSRDLSSTRKPVNYNEVPVFKEGVISLRERFKFASPYLLVLILYTTVIFYITYLLFIRYDVR